MKDGRRSLRGYLRGGGCRTYQLARFESIALRKFAAEPIELDGVRFRFHAFSDDLHAEIMGERHDRAQDHGPCTVPVLAHERLIDFDCIERKSLQI